MDKYEQELLDADTLDYYLRYELFNKHHSEQRCYNCNALLDVLGCPNCEEDKQKVKPVNIKKY